MSVCTKLRHSEIRSTNTSFIDVVECQPRPHVVSEEELQSKLWSESTRIQTRTSSFTMDRNCVTLHRCSKHGGCCHGQTECSPKKTEVVSIDINIHVSTAMLHELWLGEKRGNIPLVVSLEFR